MPKKGKKGRLTSSSSADEEDSVSSHAAVKGNKSGPIKCNKCQGSGHFSRDCPVKKQQRQEKAKCWVCGKQGHSRRECPGVDGESWCSKNKGKSAPPKGDEEGHRAAAAASVGSKRGKARYDDAEDQTLLEVFALTRDSSPSWIDGYTHLDMVLKQDRKRTYSGPDGLRDFLADHAPSASALLGGEKGSRNAMFGGCVIQIEPDLPAGVLEAAFFDPAAGPGRVLQAWSDSAGKRSTALLEDRLVLGAFVGLPPHFAALVGDGGEELAPESSRREQGPRAASIKQALRSALQQHTKVFAVGGCGIDLTGVEAQEAPRVLRLQVALLRIHLQVAAQEGVPLGVVLKTATGEAEEALVQVLSEQEACKHLPVILLNYQASPAMPLRLKHLGFSNVLVGLSPAITFAKLQGLLGETVFDTPLSHVWVSSDSPATRPSTCSSDQPSLPAPMSHPLHTASVLSKVAEIKRLGVPHVVAAVARSMQSLLHTDLHRCSPARTAAGPLAGQSFAVSPTMLRQPPANYPIIGRLSNLSIE